jgi:hypothetical protein
MWEGIARWWGVCRREKKEKRTSLAEEGGKKKEWLTEITNQNYEQEMRESRNWGTERGRTKRERTDENMHFGDSCPTVVSGFAIRQRDLAHRFQWDVRIGWACIWWLLHKLHVTSSLLCWPHHWKSVYREIADCWDMSTAQPLPLGPLLHLQLCAAPNYRDRVWALDICRSCIQHAKKLDSAIKSINHK